MRKIKANIELKKADKKESRKKKSDKKICNK